MPIFLSKAYDVSHQEPSAEPDLLRSLPGRIGDAVRARATYFIARCSGQACNTAWVSPGTGAAPISVAVFLVRLPSQTRAQSSVSRTHCSLDPNHCSQRAAEALSAALANTIALKHCADSASIRSPTADRSRHRPRTVCLRRRSRQLRAQARIASACRRWYAIWPRRLPTAATGRNPSRCLPSPTPGCALSTTAAQTARAAAQIALPRPARYRCAQHGAVATYVGNDQQLLRRIQSCAHQRRGRFWRQP